MSKRFTSLRARIGIDQDQLDITPYLYLLPVVVAYAVFMLYPLLEAFLMSFKRFTTLTGQNQWVGLANYRMVLTDPLFWHSFTNTALFSLGMVFIPLVFGLGLAVLLDSEVYATSTFRALLFSPVVVPIVVAGYLFVWIFNLNGILNSVLLTLGVIESRIAWLSSSNLALPSVMVMTVWRRTGYYMVILLAGLQSIPDTVYEAAKVQGKSRWQMFRYITVPLLKPAILIAVIIGLIDTIKLFAHVFVMTGGGPAHASEILSTYFYEITFTYFEMGKGTATAFILFVLALVLSLFVIRVSRETGGDPA